MQCSIEVAPGLREIPSIELVFAGDEITRPGERGLACFFQRSKLVGVDVSVVNNFRRQVSINVNLGVGNKGRKVVVRILRRCNSGSNTACFHPVNQRGGNGVGVVAYVVFQMWPAFVHPVGPDLAAIFEVDHVCRTGPARGCEEE